MTRPARLGAILEYVIQQNTPAQVRVGSVTWNAQGVHIDRLELRSADYSDEAGQLFEAVDIEIQPVWRDVLWGRPSFKHLKIRQATAYLVEDVAAGTFTIEPILRAMHFDDGSQEPPLEQLLDSVDGLQLPEGESQRIEIVRARIEDGVYHETDRLMAVAKISSDPNRPSEYMVAFTPLAGAPQEQPAVAASIDTQTPAISLRLADFQFTPDTGRLMPHPMQQWWSHYQPQGRIDKLDLQLERVGGQASVAASLTFDQGGVSLVWESLQTRMRRMSGRITLLDDKVRIDEIRGIVNDIEYVIHGRVDALSAEPPLKLTVSTEPFEVPTHLDEIYALPPEALEHYERLNPSGKYALQLTLERRHVGEPLTHETWIRVIDGRMMYHDFKYPVHALNGRIHIQGDTVTVEKLEGLGPSGAHITMMGRISPAGNEAQVDLKMTADDVPVDEHLRAALSPERQKWLDQFLNKPAYDRLVQAGVIAADEQTGHEQAIPVFTLGGTADVAVDIYRPPGPDREYRKEIRLDPTGLSAVMQGWPYPATAESGQVVIDEGGAKVQQLVMRGPTGARAVIDGQFTAQPNGSDVEPDFKVNATYFPIDSLLLATLPPEQAAWLHDSGLQGVLKAQGKVTKSASSAHPVDFEIDAELAGLKLNPFDSDLAVDIQAGNATLVRSGLQLHEVQLTEQDFQLTLDADVDWSGAAPRLAANVWDAQVQFSKRLLAGMPKQSALYQHLHRVVEEYGLETQFAGKAECTVDMADLQASYRLTVVPNSIELQWNEHPVRITNMDGVVNVQPQKISFDQVHGDYEEIAVGIDGVMFTDTRSCSLTIDASAPRIGEGLRSLLSESARNVLDELKVQSAYRFENAKFVHAPNHDQLPECQFKGEVTFEKLQGKLVVPVRNAQGKVDVELIRQKPQEALLFDMQLQASQVNIADRLVKALDASITTAENGRVVRFSDIRGTMYGGAVTGEGKLELSPTQPYAFKLLLQNAELGPFIAANSQVSNQPMPADQSSPGNVSEPKRHLDTGLLSASLSVQGEARVANSARGSGQLDITRASLFRQPLALALLHTINVAFPTTDSFEAASARYRLMGSTVAIESLTFWSPSAAITGRGRMQLPSTKLDLAMVARNPSGLTLGPISELLDVVKDEIMGIRVNGTLRNPDAHIVSFEGIRSAWNRVFSE